MKTFYSLMAALIAVSGFGFGQGLATAQVSITEVSSSNSFGEDWFELTNFGESTVDLNGFYWDDDGPTGNDGALFGDFSLAAGESLIVLEGGSAGADPFRALFGLDASLQILTEDDFTGPDTFSGLSGNGDEISIFDTDPNVPGVAFTLIDFVEFPAAAAQGVSFDVIDGNPIPSISGTLASNGDVASPGIAAAVPEPGSVALLTVLSALAGVSRRRA